jgi:hypothetical protein
MRRLVPEGGRTAMEPEYPLTGAMGSILGSVKDAATLPGRALYGEVPRADEMPQGEAVGEALNMAGMVSLPALRGGRAANTVSMSGASDGPGIKAYHGSPHDFDRFSLDKIGTGEGAQAYGHGLYFAENEGVATQYRNTLSRAQITIDGRGLTGPEMDAAQVLRNYGGDIDRTIEELRGMPGRYETDRVLHEWKASGNRPNYGGRMYEVNIKANPDEFLDWDKPVYEQTGVVKERLRNAGIDPEDYPKWTVKPTAKGGEFTVYNVWGEPSGTFKSEAAAMAKAAEGTAEHNKGGGAGTYLRAGGGGRSGGAEASAKLREAGIPGIRYLDQVSRGTGAGTSNYVVFDDSMIEILRKYGLLGPLGLGAGAAAVGTNDGT